MPVGKGNYAMVAALLIGLAGFLSVLLMSPRLGDAHTHIPEEGRMSRWAYLTFTTTTLLDALPRAHAFVAKTAGSLTRAPVTTASRPYIAVAGRYLRQARSSIFFATTPTINRDTTAQGQYLRGLTRGRSPSAPLMSGSGDGEMSAAAAMQASSSEVRVLVPVADGTEEIEAVTIIDTLVRAGAVVTVASVGDDKQVTCSRGVKIVADCKLAECEAHEWNAVVCPGGMPGATHLRDSKTLEDILQKQNSAGRTVAAICAAPAVVLASFGILDGHKATCYPAGPFQAKIPDLVEKQVVVDGNIVTSQGPATAMAFALQLVEVLFGVEKAKEVGDAMLSPQNG